MADITIHTIGAATWTRYGKWRVELELVDHPKRVCWLTAAQYDFLVSAFGHTRNGYSDGRVAVIGTFSDDGKGYYQRCRAVSQPPKPSHFTPLIEEAGIDDALRDAD